MRNYTIVKEDARHLRRSIKPAMITPARVADAERYLRLILEAIDADVPVFVRSKYTNRFALFDEVLAEPVTTEEDARALFFALSLAYGIFAEHALEDARQGPIATSIVGAMPLMAELGLREEVKPATPEYEELMKGKPRLH
jgi:hypothetical protein